MQYHSKYNSSNSKRMLNAHKWGPYHQTALQQGRHYQHTCDAEQRIFNTLFLSTEGWWMIDAGSGSIGWVPASYLAPVEVGNKQEVLENETLVGPEEGKTTEWVIA